MRKCLAEEFSDLYVFHLRGDIRKNMLSKGLAKEGQNVFGSGSMTGISIAIMVKSTSDKKRGVIHFGSISIYYAWRPVIEHTMNKIMGAAHGSSGFFGVA